MSNTYIYDKTVTEDGEIIESENTTVAAPRKQIFITNGTGGCGKDTFAIILQKFVGVTKISSINYVKRVARHMGWSDDKTERGRKFLSDLKLALTEYNDLPFMDIYYEVRMWRDYDSSPVLLIDIREPNEIERAKKEFDAKTILIKNDRVAPITSNMADANVLNYEYDFVIENNGTLEEFEETIKKWAEENVM